MLKSIETFFHYLFLQVSTIFMVSICAKIISDNSHILNIFSSILTKHNLISIYDKSYHQELVTPNLA